jgi:hypothetical protein
MLEERGLRRQGGLHGRERWIAKDRSLGDADVLRIHPGLTRADKTFRILKGALGLKALHRKSGSTSKASLSYRS